MRINYPSLRDPGHGQRGGSGRNPRLSTSPATPLASPRRASSSAYTAKVGPRAPGSCKRRAPTSTLAQTNADATRSRYPVAVVNDVSAVDVDVSVRFRPVSGRVDQAAGLVWRYQNEDNYYLVRANALENNVVLYKVERGRRTDLPVKGEGRTYGKAAKVPAAQWSTLRVVANGPRFEVFFNGGKLYEVEDATFAAAGSSGCVDQGRFRHALR